MRDCFQPLSEQLLDLNSDISAILNALVKALSAQFGSDADSVLAVFASDYEATAGDVGELARLAVSECPVTNGQLEVYPPASDASMRCCVLRARVGKKDSLRVAIVGNRFLSFRKLRAGAQKIAKYLGFAQSACVVRAKHSSIPRNWWESLSAVVTTCKDEGSVVFFAPAEPRRFPNIWAFESRIRDWISLDVLPRMPGARALCLTNGIYAVVSKQNAGIVRDVIGERYRDASFRDGRFDLRAALLPIPPYFEESMDAVTVLCEDAARLLAECCGDEISVTISRGKDE